MFKFVVRLMTEHPANRNLHQAIRSRTPIVRIVSSRWLRFTEPHHLLTNQNLNQLYCDSKTTNPNNHGELPTSPPLDPWWSLLVGIHRCHLHLQGCVPLLHRRLANPIRLSTGWDGALHPLHPLRFPSHVPSVGKSSGGRMRLQRVWVQLRWMRLLPKHTP